MKIMTAKQAITHIIEDRKKNKQAPYCAMLTEAEKLSTENDFRGAIRDLINQGEVVIARTINSFSFYLKKDIE